MYLFRAGLVRGCKWFCQKLHLDMSGAAQKFVKSFKRCTWICKGIHVDLSEAVCEFVRSRLLSGEAERSPPWSAEIPGGDPVLTRNVLYGAEKVRAVLIMKFFLLLTSLIK